MPAKGRLAATLTPIRAHQVIRWGRRYLPITRTKPRHLRYKVKTVLTKNERDGGCPIRYRHKREDTKTMSIFGSSIDHFFDLSDHIGGAGVEFQSADACLLLCEQV
jgi:hypothetical protein